MNMKLRDLILASLFAALMIVGAYLKIPTPFGVALTFQLFFAVYAGLLLNVRAAVFSQIIYMLLGLIGLPVFTTGSGIGYVLTPTFGFIIGFVLTAGIIAFLVKREKEIIFVRILGISVIGYLATYIIGNLYFYMIMNLVLGKEMSLVTVFSIMSLYMVKDFVLLIIAAMTSTAIIPILRRAGYVTA